MMKIIFTAAIVLCAASALLTVSAAPLSLYKWEEIPRSAAISTTEFMHDLKFFLPLRNEHLLSAEKGKYAALSTADLAVLAASHESDCLAAEDAAPKNAEDDVSVRLSLWRRILSPACDRIAAMKKHLREAGNIDTGTECSLQFDHIHCPHLTVGQVTSLFKISMSSLVRVQEIRAKTLYAPKISVKMGADLATVATIPSGIYYLIGGLQVGTEQQQPRSHMEMHQDDGKQQEQQSASSLNDPVDTSAWPPVINTNNAQIIGFRLHRVTSIPASESTFYFYDYTVTLPCRDGSQSSMSMATKDISCPTAGNLPIALYITIRRTNDSALLSEEKFVLENNLPEMCYRANITGNGPANRVVCRVFSDKRTSLPLWQPVVVGVVAGYSGQNSTVFFAQSFKNQTYFGLSTTFPTTAFDTQTGNLPRFKSGTGEEQRRVFQVTPGATTISEDYRTMYGVAPSSPIDLDGSNDKRSDRIVQAVLEFSGGGGPSQFGTLYNKSDVLKYVAQVTNATNGKWAGTDNAASRIIYLETPPTALPAEYGAPGESQLDIMCIVGTSRGLKSAFLVYNATHNNFAIDIANFVQLVVTQTGALAVTTALPYAPTTWSISYGSGETPDAPTLAAVTRAQTYAATASSAGISIFVSSGDDGSAPAGLPTLTNSIPASLPAVIAVGATAKRQAPDGKTMFVDVASALLGDLITSGGGPSILFNSPDYQNEVVFGDITQIYSQLPPKYLAGSRMTPDVSALGSYILIVLDGQNISVSGTSASSPIFSSLIALVNNDLSNAGYAPIKNIARFLYQNSDTFFTDVVSMATTGSGRGFGNNINCYDSVSWTANVGFDAATGIGEPKQAVIAAKAVSDAAKATVPPKSGLSGGAIAGIVIGCLVGVVIIAVAGYYFKKNRDAASTGAYTDVQGSNNNGAQQNYGGAQI